MVPHSMVLRAKPLDFERLRIVFVVGLGWCSAFLARLASKFTIGNCITDSSTSFHLFRVFGSHPNAVSFFSFFAKRCRSVTLSVGIHNRSAALGISPFFGTGVLAIFALIIEGIFVPFIARLMIVECRQRFKLMAG